MQRDDSAVGWDAVAGVGVFGFGEVRKGAGEDGAPAEDFFHAGVDISELRFVIECWEAVGTDQSVQLLLCCAEGEQDGVT